MPDAPLASVAVCENGRLRTVAYSATDAATLDELQFSAGEGPCLEAIESGQAVLATDLAAESRWHGSAAGLAAKGVRSLHSQPLTFDSQVRGALNLYSERCGGFARETRVAAQVTAEQAGVLLRSVQHEARLKEVIEQLREALTTRMIIDQALGIIMARRRCTAPAAFEILRRSSQSRNVKVHHIAADIVQAVSGQPPQRPHFDDPPPPHEVSRL